MLEKDQYRFPNDIWKVAHLSSKFSLFFHPARWDEYLWAMYNVNIWMGGKQAQVNYFLGPDWIGDKACSIEIKKFMQGRAVN